MYCDGHYLSPKSLPFHYVFLQCNQIQIFCSSTKYFAPVLIYGLYVKARNFCPHACPAFCRSGHILLQTRVEPIIGLVINQISKLIWNLQGCTRGQERLCPFANKKQSHDWHWICIGVVCIVIEPNDHDIEQNNIFLEISCTGIYDISLSQKYPNIIISECILFKELSQLILFIFC